MRWDQIRAGGEAPLLRLTIYRFSGSFLSLAMAIPAAKIAQIRSGHTLGVSFHARASRPIALNTRLNLIVNGQREDLSSHRILGDCAHAVDFDLRRFDLTKETALSAWVDLILREPSMVEIDLKDVSITLRPS
ncbi:hypothetical protein KHP62_05665 [Rhodobacteraceae bacterium NNCM2]|nr:hypothetical protein [Coraliihabitans acroporae]